MSAQLNLCNLPPWIIASTEFNEDPAALEIQGVVQENRRLFELLHQVEDGARRAHIFNDYMSVKCHLHQWADADQTSGALSSLKNSYLRFLRGWGVDSNSVEGAVLKGWVESRFGIPPCYRMQPLRERDSDYSPYLMDRTKGSARTNAINLQLDVLYTYTQYELDREQPGPRWLCLYRGTYDRAEHSIVQQKDRRRSVVQLNNLCSFTSDREKAWEFGTTVWRVQVPTVKVFFFGDLLPQSILKGENEYLVIGERYEVEGLLF